MHAKLGTSGVYSVRLQNRPMHPLTTALVYTHYVLIDPVCVCGVGPDICGPGTKKVHVILSYKGENKLTKKDIRCKDDEFTHLYTLILRPDNTYEVKIDNKRAEGGAIEDDWDILLPKDILDPEATKPEDWDDRAKIPDPEDTKPEEWDKPEYIPDPEAKMPEDWDDEMDGEWEPPMIPNPDYKGEWTAKLIDNPDYQGEWVHPHIPNPDYEQDEFLYRYEDFGVIGFDLWQVKSGTIFDNVLICDDEEYAEKFGEETWGATKGPEKEMKDAQDEEERKKREAEAAAKAEEEVEEEEEEEEDDDDWGDDFPPEDGEEIFSMEDLEAQLGDEVGGEGEEEEAGEVEEEEAAGKDEL
ncbi:Calreticulin [Geodia barretti]|uniref:Calreticulin n=1 Tax=Geodia barretti TaxID=519541 RepID=A0AA35R418_GEOBA|nr:Calreticulin [Geodia barretti]CAI8001498.1 Calreticulin [Geodia barretti]